MGACSLLVKCWPCIAEPQGSAHSPLKQLQPVGCVWHGIQLAKQLTKQPQQRPGSSNATICNTVWPRAAPSMTGMHPARPGLPVLFKRLCHVCGYKVHRAAVSPHLKLQPQSEQIFRLLLKISVWLGHALSNQSFLKAANRWLFVKVHGAQGGQTNSGRLLVVCGESACCAAHLIVSGGAGCSAGVVRWLIQ